MQRRFCSLNSSTISSLKASELNESLCLVNIVHVINQGEHNPRTVGIITSIQLRHFAGFFWLEAAGYVAQYFTTELLQNKSKANRIAYRNVKHLES